MAGSTGAGPGRVRGQGRTGSCAGAAAGPQAASGKVAADGFGTHEGERPCLRTWPALKMSPCVGNSAAGA